ncbi:Ig-like domain-containing protein [Planctomycetota bacterium]|nr:Ig-like domain-containing protein [Planctomycetota bacterium]
MTEPKPTPDHNAPSPRGDDDVDEVTQIAEELEAEHLTRRTTGVASKELDELASENPPSNPYFQRSSETPTAEVKALRPLSEAVVQPLQMPDPDEAIALEPTSDDEILHQAILTKRLPVPPEKEEVTVEDLEGVEAVIPEAKGSDTEIRQVLEQAKVYEDPGLLFDDEHLFTIRTRLDRGLTASLHRQLQARVTALVDAKTPIPFGREYYTLAGVSDGADVSSNQSLVEVAFFARLGSASDALVWAKQALLAKCAQGQWHAIVGADPQTPPDQGCVNAIRDVALASDFLRTKLSEEELTQINTALYTNGKRLWGYITDERNNVLPSVSEQGAMALGLAGMPLMSHEAWYHDARRWVDTAEQRCQNLLSNRIADNGRPAASDLAGLVQLLRFVVPFTEAFSRYYDDDMLQGEGGNLSQFSKWAAHQFGSARAGLFASGRVSVDDLKNATGILCKLGDTYRDGVAQWLLQQISVAHTTDKREHAGKGSTGRMQFEMPANAGIDAVIALSFYDPGLASTSPEESMVPGAKLSDTRAVVRSDWDAASPIVSLQAEHGSLPYMQIASAGVNLRATVSKDLFAGLGTTGVPGRVRDYVDMGGAAYINGDFKGNEGSLAQRHVLFLRAEQIAILFDRFDMGDGRGQKQVRLNLEGTGDAREIDRGTLSIRATDGTDRRAQFVFFSNGFSRGVDEGNETTPPGLTVEFARGRGDLATIASLGESDDLPLVKRLNPEERGRVYRATVGDGAVLFNGWPNGMPQQCGWIWTDAQIGYVDRADDYPGRYTAIKATSVLAYDMAEGIHLGFGASHPDDPNKPVEFSLCAGGAQAVLYLSTRAHVRVAFPGLKSVRVDGMEVEIEGESKVFVISKPLEPGKHLIEFEHVSPGPESAIAFPAEGQLVGGQAKFVATIGDPIGVDSARLLIDDEYHGAVLEAGPWEWPVNTSQLSEGIHEACIEGKDVLGNVRRSDVRAFQIDNTPPEVVLNQPVEGKRLRGDLNFVAEAFDPNGVERVQFCIDGKKVGEPVTMPPYSRQVDSTAFPDGEHVVTAMAFDAAGNVGQSESTQIVLTNDAPPPKLVKLKIAPPVLAVQQLEEVQLTAIGIDDEDGEQPVRVQWRRIKGSGVVSRSLMFTAPSIEGACVMEAQIVGTNIRCKIHAMVGGE